LFSCFSAIASCDVVTKPAIVIIRTGLKNSFVARLKRCEARRGKRGKKPEVYPLRYTEDFFAKFDEVAARISSTGAEDTFETGSTTGLKNSFVARLKRCEETGSIRVASWRLKDAIMLDPLELLLMHSLRQLEPLS
jgi:hypothetical protein